MDFKLRVLVYLFIALLFVLQVRFGIFYRPEFRPRTLAEIERSAGDLSVLDKKARRAYSSGGMFEPIEYEKLNGSAWLKSHYEPGQTFDEFAASYGGADEKRNRLYLLPLGEFTSETSILMDKLKLYCSIFFNMPCEIMKPADFKFRSRINSHTGKPQLLTGDIIKAMNKLLPADAYAMLALTMTDLYPVSSWNFVFGQASLTGRVGVYSLARYDPEFFGRKREADYQRILLERSLKVMAHETGHMFYMYHCVFYKCLMNGSNSLVETDMTPMFLCPACLRKLSHAVKFDPVVRYGRMLEFFEANGLGTSAVWLKKRIEYINMPE
ncbi:MAG TPA: archaemetzincin [Candidatus Wallbacteria bacterium]|nr:MAG: Peptidase family M54 [bacterium ADurb.Bin243]HOD42354.1 archaemetzincin [Candidatus Wallbacteria bacterium]HPG56794.1 archaemetzincin [Candidatus Wallbacteria bacterium]